MVEYGIFDSNRMSRLGIHVRPDATTRALLMQLADRCGTSTSYLIEAILLDWLERRSDHEKAAKKLLLQGNGIPKMRRSRARLKK